MFQTTNQLSMSQSLFHFAVPGTIADDIGPVRRPPIRSAGLAPWSAQGPAALKASGRGFGTSRWAQKLRGVRPWGVKAKST